MWLIKKKKKLHEPSARDSRLESYYFGGTKPAQANILRDHILKIPNTKKGWWSNAGVEHLPSKHEAKFISQNNQKKKKRRTWCHMLFIPALRKQKQEELETSQS
jgi:hypothetical protein